MRMKQEHLVLLIILLVGIISISVSTQFTGLATQQAKKADMQPGLVAYKFYEQEEITFSPYECPFDFELTTKDEDIYSSPITGRAVNTPSTVPVFYPAPNNNNYNGPIPQQPRMGIACCYNDPSFNGVVVSESLIDMSKKNNQCSSGTMWGYDVDDGCTYKNGQYYAVSFSCVDSEFSWATESTYSQYIKRVETSCGSQANSCSNGACVSTTVGPGGKCTSQSQCPTGYICGNMGVGGGTCVPFSLGQPTPPTPTTPPPALDCGQPTCHDPTEKRNYNPTTGVAACNCNWNRCGNNVCELGESNSNCQPDCFQFSSGASNLNRAHCGDGFGLVNTNEYCDWQQNSYKPTTFTYISEHPGVVNQNLLPNRGQAISCATLGYQYGTPGCDFDCLINTGTCTNTPPQICGDGICNSKIGEDSFSCSNDCSPASCISFRENDEVKPTDLQGRMHKFKVNIIDKISKTVTTTYDSTPLILSRNQHLITTPYDIFFELLGEDNTGLYARVCLTEPAPIGGTCTTNAGCQTGLVCTSNVCSLPGLNQQCNPTVGCAGNLLCQNNICTNPQQPIGGSCTTNSNCQTGLVCTNNVCSLPGLNQPCYQGTCQQGYTCNSNVCTIPNQGQPCTTTIGCSGNLLCQNNICTQPAPVINCNNNNICDANEDATNCPSDCDLGTLSTFCTTSSSGIQLLSLGQTITFTDSQGLSHTIELISIATTTKTAIIKYDGTTMSLNLKQHSTTSTYDILLALIGSNAQGNYARICANIPVTQSIIGCSHTFTNAVIYFWDGIIGSKSSGQPTGTDTYVIVSYNGPDWDKYPDQKGVKWSIQGKEFPADPTMNVGWTPQPPGAIPTSRTMTVKLTGLQPGQANLELQSDAGAFCRTKQVLIPTPTAPPPPLTCADVFTLHSVETAFFEQGQRVQNNAVKGPDSQVQVKLAGINLGYTVNDFKFTVDGNPSGRITEVTEDAGYTYIKSDITFTQTPTLVSVTDSQGIKCSQDIPIAWTQRVAPALCGNGQLDPGELCDKGAANSNNPDAECRTDCRPRRCMDLICDANSGETKDTCPRDCAPYCDQTTPCADPAQTCITTFNRCITPCKQDQIMGNDLICRDRTTVTQKKPEAAKAPERKYEQRTFEEIITYCPELFQIPANKQFKIKFKTPTDPRVPEKLRRLIDPKLPLVVTCSGVTNVAEVIKVPGNVYENTFTLAVPPTSCTFRVLKDKVAAYVSPEYSEISTRTTSAEEIKEIRDTEPPEQITQPTSQPIPQQPTTERPSSIPTPPLAQETPSTTEQPSIERPTTVQEPIKIIGTPSSGKTIKIKITSTSQEPEIVVNLLSDASRYPKLITAKFKKKINTELNEYEAEITPYKKEADLK
ncbi:hypothetical protein HZA97_09830 [Candidatus Woesearchaeota archaeon]|nr:hypothetical protein [Candidatus Woesearchaeota archaeon]